MAQATVTSAGFETVADLLEKLGGVPANRVRLRPAPGTATEQDVIALEAREDRLFELIDGVLVEKGMGFFESYLAFALGRILGNHVVEHNLGIVVGSDAMMRLWPGRVRIPDVAFISWARLPDHAVPQQPLPDLAPDLAIEVLSKSNTAREMDLKLQDYFHAGVRMVWYIDPPTRTARVYTSVDQMMSLDETQSLDGGDVVPGFSLSLRELFATPRPG